MDEATKLYRAAQLEKMPKQKPEYPIMLKIVHLSDQTNWIALTMSEFEAIQAILTGKAS